MAKIKNITTDDVGYRGIRIPAGASIEVDEKDAVKMTATLPDKFELAEDRSMAGKPKRGKPRKTSTRAVK